MSWPSRHCDVFWWQSKIIQKAVFLSFFVKKIKKAKEPMHGRISKISHANIDKTRVFEDIFKGVISPFKAVRYHSLIVDKGSLRDNDELIITAETDDDVIMALQHKQRPLYGLQFHPEVYIYIYLYIKLKVF